MRGEKKVNISAIINNLNYVRQKTGVKVICVIKANAYGHGAYRIAKELNNEDGYAVATAEEALEVKDAVNGKFPVLILGKTERENYYELIKNKVVLTSDSEEELTRLNCVAGKMSTCACAHIAINTGMNRIGLKDEKSFYKLINYAQTLKNLKVCGVFSHLYSQEESVMERQRKRFLSVIKSVGQEKNLLIHLGATSSVVKKDFYFDAIRLGLGLYGYGAENLTPAMTVSGQVVAVNLLRAGETVGYCGKFVAEKPEYIATLSLGYADGIPRRYTGGEILIGGKRRKIVGNICMDACFAQVDEKVKPGDRAIFIGQDGNKIITAEDMANSLGTISYEVLTGFRRIKTVYND